VELKTNGTLMILFLGALAATAPLSIDIGLPGFAATAAALGVPVSLMPQTLSVFLVGFSVGPLILGPMADRFGRRPILVAGLIIFVVGGLGATLSMDFAFMLGSRLVQGVGAGTAATLPFAIARDIYQGDEARVRMSAITLVLGLGPIIAPILGTVALSLSGWRCAYALLAASGILSAAVAFFCFKESAPTATQQMTWTSVMSNYRSVLINPAFLRNTLVNACSFGVMFAYIAGSPEVLTVDFGMSSGQYSLSFALTAGALMCGSLLGGKLALRGWPSAPIANFANALIALASLILTAITLSGELNAVIFVLAVALVLLGVGLLSPNVIHDALQPMGKMAGVATAVLRGIQMVLAGCASALVGTLQLGNSALSTACVMAAFAIASLAIQRLGVRKSAVAVS
jgi:DHA1 family bicyclomycin/chloramphenicol resistance-like MFS transporter